MKKFHSALFDFCWFPNYDASIEYLANNIADPEPWDFSDATQAKYSILKSYIEHTFRKIKSENKISFSSSGVLFPYQRYPYSIANISYGPICGERTFTPSPGCVI